LSKVDKTVAREVGKYVVSMAKLVDDDSRHLIAKLMDIYWQMPSNHQRCLLKHLLDSTGIDPKWRERADDETEWANVFRETVWYYSGRAEIGQPSKKELKTLILKYVTSKYCEEALESPSEDFSEMLKEIE
jgi:hypothetical protein